MEKSEIETKAAGHEVGEAFDEFMRAFEAFKETNDERLAEIERRCAADVVTTDKLARIDRALDDNKRVVEELALKAARPPLGGAGPRSGASLAHKAAFDGYVRRGEAGQLRALEGKALSVASDPDGGYLVPDETERAVNRSLRDVSPIRAIAGLRQVSSAVYKKPFSLTGPGTGWVGETAARPETTTPTLAELSFPTMELYAMPAATPALLDDSAVSIDEWLAEEVRLAFAVQEGQAFVTGNGVNKPRGFTDDPKVANASWSWGNIGYIATGTAGAFPASNPSDKLIDLAYAVKSGYRANAHFVMNRATQAVIRKFKDVDGNYIWQPSAKPGEAPSLLGHPVTEAEDMPSIGTDTYAIAFGDFRRGYLVVDRVGIRVLRDPYSSKPYVLFYTTKRVGGGAGYVAARQVPWPGGIAIYGSPETAGYTLRALATAPATMGRTLDPLPGGPLSRIDRATRVRVLLDGGALQSATPLQVLAGSNAAAVRNADGEWEVLQFETAVLVAPLTYEPSGLLRGQAGTEGAMRASVAAGAPFVLVDGAIARIDLTLDEIGLPYSWRYGPASRGVGDATYAERTQAFQGLGLKPLSPAHLAGTRDASGDLAMSWVRRTRFGGDGWDAAEVPLAEADERYELDILDGALVKRTLSVSTPAATYTAAQQIADFGAPQAAISTRVYQLSAVTGRGSPAVAVV